MADPTLDPGGNPVQHDTYPPGSIELYERVRALILAEYADRIDPDSERGRVLLQLVASRIVKAARMILQGTEG